MLYVGPLQPLPHAVSSCCCPCAAARRALGPWCPLFLHYSVAVQCTTPLHLAAPLCCRQDAGVPAAGGGGAVPPPLEQTGRPGSSGHLPHPRTGTPGTCCCGTVLWMLCFGCCAVAAVLWLLGCRCRITATASPRLFPWPGGTCYVAQLRHSRCGHEVHSCRMAAVAMQAGVTRGHCCGGSCN